MNKRTKQLKESENLKLKPMPGEDSLDTEKDRLDTFLFNAVNWFYKHRVILLSIAIIIFLVISSIYAYIKYQEYQASQREIALYKAEQVLVNAKDVAVAKKQVIANLEKYVTTYKGTKQAGTAFLRLAGFYEEQKQSEKVEKVLVNAMQSFSNRDAFFTLSASLLANYYFDHNKKQEALQTVLKIPQKRRTAVILMQIASFYKDQGKKKEAISQLELLKKLYPNSTQFNVAQTLLDELKN